LGQIIGGHRPSWTIPEQRSTNVGCGKSRCHSICPGAAAVSPTAVIGELKAVIEGGPVIIRTGKLGQFLTHSGRVGLFALISINEATALFDLI